ncbi:secondary Metabolism [Methylobacterium phyllosphaerae]|uniref:Nucleoside-diphosphate-sugar epimerase n=1 Tax=Methylobacterium phyllosphaerae TaxID=418223 RepID=A0AAE8HV60_9HYPH|nr:NmrA family NAD(P)-binding protein [Methylobacterium phyllosphaerae]APT34838.1 secondary Metabolism [Methylobacterium phyllosphaerae]SFH35198.1 Nucleoside-diphosphate-sugar epimerase [Methylobacterium phyllosphaerae]
MDGEQTRKLVVVAGATGDLGTRIVKALAAKGTPVRALVRRPVSDLARDHVQQIPVDFGNGADLTHAVTGAACVVSALNGTAPVILDTQGQLLDATVAAGVPRFIPSDFCLDYRATRPGDNRNMDLRRRFAARLDTAPIRATSIFNGPFADLLTGQAPIVLHRFRRVLFWGDADQVFDFTAKDDVAAYTADAALDPAAPRHLRISGDQLSPRGLAELLTGLGGRRWRLLRAGGIGRLSAIIAIARALTPKTDAPFPAWQGMQYLRDMSTGRGKLHGLDNARYGKADWTSAAAVLAPTIR